MKSNVAKKSTVIGNEHKAYPLYAYVAESPTFVNDTVVDFQIIRAKKRWPPSPYSDPYYEDKFIVLNDHAVGYKKVSNKQADYSNDDGKKYTILTLLIPAGAIVYTKHGKCRASEALVIAPLTGQKYWSMYKHNFVYEFGQYMTPLDPMCRDFKECASGIHFFRTYQQAFDYK